MTAYDVIVAGAGAAGIMAAISAAERGRSTLLLEKNRHPGVKILMSGGTRCNLTHATDARGISAEFGLEGRFLHSALAALTPAQLVDVVEAEGVATKVEATGKIFPVSNKASDVLQSLLNRLALSGCRLVAGEPLVDVARDEDGFVLRTTSRSLQAASLIIATGGLSYPGSGTTGDGYRLAATWGHTLVPPRPALTPITTDCNWVKQLQGVTVPDVNLRVVVDEEIATGRPRRANPRNQRRGSLLFAHFGLSGPAALDVSRQVSGQSDPSAVMIECDFWPALSEEALAARFIEDAAAQGRRQVVSLLSERLPHRLAEMLVAQANIAADRRLAELERAERTRIVAALKRTLIRPTGTRGFRQAEVTAGGIVLDEVDSRTMQSKLVPGLYLAGEVLDLDGPIGGYNFQAAFSTGWLAGRHV